MTKTGYFWRDDPPGFVPDDSATPVPEGAPRVSRARHAELLLGQAAGAVIVSSPSTGRPVLQQPAQATDAPREAAVRRIKREAARRIAAVSPIWRQLNDQREPSPEGLSRFARIDAIRAASNAIEESVAGAPIAALHGFPIAENPLWPEFD